MTVFKTSAKSQIYSKKAELQLEAQVARNKGTIYDTYLLIFHKYYKTTPYPYNYDGDKSGDGAIEAQNFNLNKRTYGRGLVYKNCVCTLLSMSSKIVLHAR